MSPRPLLLVLACAGLFAGCPGGGLVTKLCGGPGQPCCEGTTCDEGARCGVDGLCTGCGKVGQACCPGAVCTEGAVCSLGECVEPLSCGTTCTLGETRCSPTGGVESCTSVGVCPEWRSVVVTCPTGTICEVPTNSTAQCVDRCPTTCTPGTSWCTVAGPQVCVQPAGNTCPTLQPDGHLFAQATCPAGTPIDVDFSWESPAPFGVELSTLVGDLSGSLWGLDQFGNILHRAAGVWSYEVRATNLQSVKALAGCGLPGRLAGAGPNGMVWRRRASAWTSESVGTTDLLLAVACSSTGTVFALTHTGTLYVSSAPGAWRSVSLGRAVSVSELVYHESTDTLVVLEQGDRARRCTTISGTPQCADDLYASPMNYPRGWVDPASGVLFAAGSRSLQLRNNFRWAEVSTLDGGAFTALSGLSSGSSSIAPTVLAGTNDGQVLTWSNIATPLLSQVPSAVDGGDEVAALFVNETGLATVATRERQLFEAQANSTYLDPLEGRGGQGPTTESLYGVSCLGRGRAVAVGSAGERLRRENGAWVSDRGGYVTDADLHDVDALDPGEAYAVGSGGVILLRRYGTWTREAEGLTTASLWGVAHDARKVYVVGEGGTWLEKTRATGAWAVVPLSGIAASQVLLDVAVTTDLKGEPLEVVAVGSRCTVLSKVGATITAATADGCLTFSITEMLTAAAFTPEGTLLIGGEEGYLAKRTTTGFSREFLDDPDRPSIQGLLVTGSSTWALTSTPGLFRRSTQWLDALPRALPYGLHAGCLDTGGGLFLVGGYGTIIHRN